MARYVVHRLIQIVPVLVGISMVVFLLVRLIPGDPATAILGSRASPALVAQIRDDLGLDRPIWEQYVSYLGDAAQGDFGVSLFYQTGVLPLALQRVPITLLLIAYSLAIAVVLAFCFASIAAVARGRFLDHVIRLAFTLVLGMPSFWLGILLILVLGVWWGLLPVAGAGEGGADTLVHLTLPALTIALAVSPILLRNLRSSLVEVIRSDYVTTGRAVGVRPRVLLVHYILRNSLLPTVTVISLSIGWLIGGTVIVESVFGIPGLGSLLITAISSRDYAIIQLVTLVMAVLVVVVNLLTDLAYVLLDPRVSL